MRLSDLKEKCKELGIKPKPTKHRLNPDRYEVSIDDCVKAIQDYTLELMRGTKHYDSNLEFITKFKSPMLANPIYKINQKIVNDIWDDNNTDWIFEEKVDGIRCFIAYNHLTNECHIYTRALDQSTMLPMDYSSRIEIGIDKMPLDFILDTEMKFARYPDMGHETMEEILADPYKDISQFKPHFVVFDIVKLGKYSFVDQKLSFRRAEAFKVVGLLKDKYNVSCLTIVNEKPGTMTKEEFYNYIVGKQGEGVIAKDLTSAYDTKGTRGNSWIKIKRNKYEGYSNVYLDTYDLFISNAIIMNNIVNGLELSSYIVDKDSNYIYDSYGNRQVKVMGILYDLRPELKNMLTSYSNSNPILNINYLNKVVEVGSSGYNPNTKKLNNLKFMCWRIDKTHESCKIQKEDIL